MNHQPSRPAIGQSALQRPPVGLEISGREDAGQIPPAPAWCARLRDALAAGSEQAQSVAEAALRDHPTDPELLLLSVLTALVGQCADRALTLLKRYAKRYQPNKFVTLLTALALAEQAQYARAWTMLQDAQIETSRAARGWFVGDDRMSGWLEARLAEIRRAARPVPAAARTVRAATKPAPVSPTKSAPALPPPPPPPLAPSAAAITDLPRLQARFDISYELADPALIDFAETTTADDAGTMFRLRSELTRLSLFEGFDELLCLPALQGVEAHWYQIETVRKVLKQYRGRVLLADEVGLGKTVEAGMVLKEYVLRGMAQRILILTPASLVGQWRDEMASKFAIACATSHDGLLRSDPGAFWAQPRVIASIAAARRKEHAELLAGQSYDVVVVDEAHHLRDQASASYRLVNSLQKRFLLLLSATPVQNSLLELYNLLTLLQPGIFKTQKEFRAAYMVPGKPREPANRERLRDLMRGVMVRNTRALAALRMPRRQASTLRATPEAEEAACYAELTALVREAAGRESAHPLAWQHLLAAAGSSPAAAGGAIARFLERAAQPGKTDARWSDLLARTRAIAAGAKERALLRLLAQNPAEKKLVFVHHRDSLQHLGECLHRNKLPFAAFAGDMTGPQKDAAVDAFRQEVPLLLCTESGGEGRNLQFCNTLINFDIPWNPMAIEQRIGRIDRIGQTREVFIFNLVTAGSIEDAMLRILDEKINMFELVVGEVGAILGEVDDQQEFSTLVLQAWLQSSEPARNAAFAELETQLLAARRAYEDVKQFDEALFGNELDAA